MERHDLESVARVSFYIIKNYDLCLKEALNAVPF